jgi:type IV pilus assembly protein PilB
VSGEAQQGPGRPPLLGELLVQARVITAEQLAEALAAPREPSKKLGQVLVEGGLITEVQLTQVLGQQLSVPWVSLSHVDFSPQLLARIPVELAERWCLVPIFVRSVKGQGDALYVAMDDPTNDAALAEASRVASLPTRPMIAATSEIRSAIRIYYYGEPASEEMPATRAEAPVAPMTTREPAMGPPTPLAAPGSVAQPAPPPPPAPASTPSTPPAHPVPPPPKMPSSVPTTAPMSAAPSTDPDPPPATHRSSPPSAVAGSSPPPSIDRPRSEPPRRSSRPPAGAKLVSLTLLDGTTIQLPARSNKKSFISDDGLTARDVISALRAAAHGADASEILGNRTQWEPIVAAILQILIRKGLISDEELMEELRKI